MPICMRSLRTCSNNELRREKRCSRTPNVSICGASTRRKKRARRRLGSSAGRWRIHPDSIYLAFSALEKIRDPKAKTLPRSAFCYGNAIPKEDVGPIRTNTFYSQMKRKSCKKNGRQGLPGLACLYSQMKIEIFKKKNGRQGLPDNSNK